MIHSLVFVTSLEFTVTSSLCEVESLLVRRLSGVFYVFVYIQSREVARKWKVFRNEKSPRSLL